VTEREAALDEGAPRFGTADTVDTNSALPLELTHGVLCARAVVGIDDERQSGGDEPLLYVTHRVAVVTQPEQRSCGQGRDFASVRRCTRPALRGAAPCPWHRPGASSPRRRRTR